MTTENGRKSSTKLFELTIQARGVAWRLYDAELNGGRRPVMGPLFVNFPPDVEVEIEHIKLLVEIFQVLIPSLRADHTFGDRSTDDERSAKVEEVTSKFVQALGEQLYNLVFQDNLRTRFLDHLKGSANLVRLELGFDPARDELAGWPWEYLYVPHSLQIGGSRFLALRTKIVLNRCISLEDEIKTLTTAKPNVLLIICRPKDQDPFDCTMVKETLERLDDDGVIGLEVTSEMWDEGDVQVRDAEVTYAKVKQFIQDHQPHVIHFVGHGRRTARGGSIAFMDANWTTNWVNEQRFADLADESKNLKLVFLQACESALPHPHRSVSGMAMQLASNNIPAVVAMQDRITAGVANTFARGFYKKLAEGNVPVDLAVQAGRNAVSELEPEQRSAAFGVPVLYLRSYDGLIVGSSAADTDTKKEAPCSKCGRLIFPEPFCSQCATWILCPKGHAIRDPEAKFCGQCSQPRPSRRADLSMTEAKMVSTRDVFVS